MSDVRTRILLETEQRYLVANFSRKVLLISRLNDGQAFVDHRHWPVLVVDKRSGGVRVSATSFACSTTSTADYFGLENSLLTDLLNLRKR